MKGAEKNSRQPKGASCADESPCLGIFDNARAFYHRSCSSGPSLLHIGFFVLCFIDRVKDITALIHQQRDQLISEKCHHCNLFFMDKQNVKFKEGEMPVFILSSPPNAHKMKHSLLLILQAQKR